MICTNPAQPPQEKNGEHASPLLDSAGEAADDNNLSWQLQSIQHGNADPTAPTIANMKTNHFFILRKGSLING